MSVIPFNYNFLKIDFIFLIFKREQTVTSWRAWILIIPVAHHNKKKTSVIKSLEREYFLSSKYEKRSIDVKKQDKMNSRSIKLWLKIKP